MHHYDLLASGFRVGILADGKTAKELATRYELQEVEGDRVDYVLGFADPESSNGSSQGRLSYGTCPLVRSRDRQLLVDAFEAHFANITATRSEAMQLLGCAITHADQLVIAPIELVATSEGWLRQLLKAGWQFHPGSRISVNADQAEVLGDPVRSNPSLSSSGKYQLAGVILDGRFGTGHTRNDDIAHVLRSCDIHPHLRAADVVSQAEGLVDADLPMLRWDVSSGATMEWLQSLL